MSEKNIATIGSSMGKKYALVVGANRPDNLFLQSPQIDAVGDAEGISAHLGEEECGFEAVQGGTLHVSEASTERVKRAVKDLIKESKQEDLLLFYFIGYSYVTSTDEGDKTYLVTDDFDPDDAAEHPNDSLSLDWIWSTFLRNKKQNDVIMILDCCSADDALNSDESVQRSMEAFLDNAGYYQQAEQQQGTQASRTWAIMVSIETDTSAYVGNGHTCMTSLILDVLSGKKQTVLDANGDLTLPALRDYLQKDMPEQQKPIIQGNFLNGVLAHNPVITNRNVFLPPPPDDTVRFTRPQVQHFFDDTICEEATANLDMEQVATFIRKPRIYRQEDYDAKYNEQQQMEAFGLALNEHPSYGALLCFGYRPSLQIAGAYTRCIYWSDSRRLSGWRDEREYRGSLLKQVVQARDFLVQHLGNQVSAGDEPEQGKIYVRVLEEALANALVHREYVTERGHRPRSEGVMVELFHDRIDILSPGGSPLKIAVLQKAAEQHPSSHPRNPQIMRIFYLAGHVERVGTGIARMQLWMQEAGLPKPELGLNEETQTFSITLRRPTVTQPEPEPEAEVNDANRQVLSGNKGSKERFRLPVASSIVLGGSSQQRNLVWMMISIVLSVALVFGASGIGVSYVVFRWFLSTPALTPSGPTSTTIEIASELPTSGLDTTSGLPVQDGVQMAIDDTNNNNLLPGYTLKLISYNDVGRGNRHDALKGVSNLRQAIADNLVAGVIGPYNSGIAVAELPIANQAAIPLISPSNTYPCLTKDIGADPDCFGSSNIEAQMRPMGQLTYFRVATTDDREGKAAADFFAGLHYHKVLLLEDDSDVYSLGLAQAFQKAWMQLGGEQPVPLGLTENASSAQDYQDTLQAAAALQPDLVYFAGNDPNGSYVLQALSKIPQLKSVAFAGASGIMDDSFLQAVANLHRSAPIYVSSPIEDPVHSGQAAGIDFESNYTANGYANYRPYAAAAYDATKILIQAIKTALQQKGVSTPHRVQDQAGAGQFRRAILQALAHLRYTGATGAQSFDTNGDTTNHTISFYQLELANTQANWAWIKQISA